MDQIPVPLTSHDLSSIILASPPFIEPDVPLHPPAGIPLPDPPALLPLLQSLSCQSPESIDTRVLSRRSEMGCGGEVVRYLFVRCRKLSQVVRGREIPLQNVRVVVSVSHRGDDEQDPELPLQRARTHLKYPPANAPLRSISSGVTFGSKTSLKRPGNDSLLVPSVALVGFG